MTIWFLVFAITLVIIWIAWALLIPLSKMHPSLADFFKADDFSRYGQWGDSFGPLTSLFSILAFCALLFSILHERKKFSAAIENEYKDQFDKTFFQLLALLRTARDEVRFRYSREYIEKNGKNERQLQDGISAFRIAWNEALWKFGDNKFDLTSEAIGRLYTDEIHRRYESTFGSYFRILYTIMARIKNDRILDASEKIVYGNLLRAQFNSFELAVLCLNGLAPISKDMRDMIIFFRLPKYLPGTRRKLLERHYPVEAFMARDV